MHEYGISNNDGTVLFNPPKDPHHVSHTILDRPTTANQAISVPVKRLSTIMNQLNHKKIDVLKMDVEGAEYGVIEDMGKSDILPQQILIEFHHRFPNVGIKKTKKAVSRIRTMGYKLFFVSTTGNEFCFIRH